MQARTTHGSVVTLTEGGILIERTGLLGINKSNKEIPFTAVRSINFEKHLIRKFWTVATRESTFYLDADNNNSNFIGELKRRIAPYQGGQTVIMQQPAPVQQITTQKEVVKLRCSHCRTLNPDTNAVCSNCGARL